MLCNGLGMAADLFSHVEQVAKAALQLNEEAAPQDLGHLVSGLQTYNC